MSQQFSSTCKDLVPREAPDARGKDPLVNWLHSRGRGSAPLRSLSAAKELHKLANPVGKHAERPCAGAKGRDSNVDFVSSETVTEIVFCILVPEIGGLNISVSLAWALDRKSDGGRQ